MAKTALVTGGAGFIGSHLVDALLAQKWEVVVVDNLATGFKKNVNPQATLRVLDIRKPATAALIRTLKPRVVFHLAAQASVPVSVKDPTLDAETNVLATIKLLEASADARVKRFVFAGTGGALSSERTVLPTDESHVVAPVSPYGIAKLASEQYGAFFRHIRKVPFVALRFANVYGPRQNPDGEAGVIAIFCKRMLAGKDVSIHGTGKQTRDYVFVQDVVDAMLRAANAPEVEGPFHVGTGVETSVNELFRYLAKLTQYRQKPLKAPADVGAPLRSALDFRKIRQELAWNPTVSLEEGLQRTVEWFRKQ